MRYPPAHTQPLAASRVYRAVACIVTIILIALCVYSMPASGHFGLKNVVFALLCAGACIGLLRDAWKAPKGRLHYTQGTWHWLQGNAQVEGTCVLHFDLQSYMLLSFTAHQSDNKIFPITTQWFHLEAKQGSSAGQPSWLALRRAVYSPAMPAAQMNSHEQRLA